MATTSGGLIAAFRQQLESLPPRSRTLLAVLVGLVALVWMAGLYWFTSSSLTTQGDDLMQRQRTLQNLQLLQVQYVQAEKLIASAEQRLGDAAQQNPSSFIEAKANEHGVREQLRSIEKIGTETRGNLKETRYRVSLQRAPVEGTMELLHDIETAGFMSTENATFKSAFVKGDRLLSLTLDLVAYELAKEE